MRNEDGRPSGSGAATSVKLGPGNGRLVSVPPFDIPIDRRRIITGGLAGGLAAAGLAVPSASAGFRGWCRTDPLISLDGELANIFVSAPFKMLVKNSGPVDYVVTVPEGVKAHLILLGVGFGRGERCRFQTSRKLKKTEEGIEVRIEVKVPARADLPLALEFAPRVLGLLWPETAEGRTNRKVVMETRF